MAVVISDRLLESSDRLLDAEPDDHLVSLVQTGHEAAFAAIVRRYERELQAQARRLSSDGRAEDAVQQAFLNAFTALQGGSEVRHLRGWLHQILRHEVTRARVPIDAPLEATVACGETLEDTVARRATAHDALAELSALPDRQRDALLGTAVLGFPRAHVARTMGLSEGAVRQLVHRARLRLRQGASALIPFPLVKLFGAARSTVDANPDAALGAGTAASAAASGGLAIKVGALLASGALATGIAVTHTSPSHHHGAATASRHQLPHAAATRHGSAASRTSAAPALVSDRLRPGHGGTAVAREDEHGHGGRGRLSGDHSGRHGGPGSGREGGQGHEGSPTGRGDDGSGHSPGGAPARGDDGSGSGSGSPSNSGSGSGSNSGSGSSSGDGGHHGGSGSPSGSTTSSAGSGSANGAASSDDGHGAGHSSGGGGSSSTDSDADTTSSPGSSGSAPATATGGQTSGGGDAGSGGGQDQSNVVSLGSDGSQTPSSGSGAGGGKENLRGSRDVSGSLDSSSS
jgi:RNA polymerase sigma factor (sigma-70 family)